MRNYVLSFKPATRGFGKHDPSAALFRDDELVFAVEEERFTRTKHSINDFPENAIQACLDFEGINLSDVDRVVLPYRPELGAKIWKEQLKIMASNQESLKSTSFTLAKGLRYYVNRRFFPETFTNDVVNKLSNMNDQLPDIEKLSHHRCHAASAFYPTNFDEALIITVDGRGEYDSTVIWKGDRKGLSRKMTFTFPNSLGTFYAIVTEFLGYHAYNGEGKVMGLAPYGQPNQQIKRSLTDIIDISSDYDVTPITKKGISAGVERLENLFNRSAKEEPVEFSDWEKDLAYVAQSLLEEVMVNLLSRYSQKLNTKTVCLAGGVALNCKMNKIIEQSNFVDKLFVQPVAHDAGLALGAGYLTSTPPEVSQMSDVYWGPSFDGSIEPILKERKLNYDKKDNIYEETAERIAEGELVGWFQGRLELGPRALGNRSILADPRKVESRDRVNRYVKHREEWRPFAPSIKESALNEYLVQAEQSPFMIKTYEVREDKREEIPAVLHPADNTTRPQTVNENQNPRYHALLSAFEDLTGVPVLLNTSFNDHAEPIVTHPVEAIKDFYGMGLDVLVIDDYILEK